MSIISFGTYSKLHKPELIKPDLAFDGENYRLNATEIRKIMATHGATIEAATDLLMNDAFQEEHRIMGTDSSQSSLGQEFYVTPNPRYDFDVDSLEGEFDSVNFADIDAILAGIEYAEGGESDYDNGVVIAFSGKLSLEGAQINTDPLFTTNAEASNGIELVLPRAPSIETVAGIYPVDAQSYHDLALHLDQATQ